MLKIGIVTGNATAESLDLVTDAERLGVDSAWIPEAWMFDGLTPAAYLAGRTETMRLGTACVQLGSRSPALLAMSALSIQAMSNGRFILGMGTSGPQVMEGWHGVRFDKPVTRTRETIEIINRIASGERVSYEGATYELPLPESQGKSMRSPVAMWPIPMYVASMGPANLRLTGEMGQGWIGTAFLAEHADVYLGPIREGAESSGRSLDDIEITVAAGLEFTADTEAAGRRHAAGYAFTIGAMGSSKTNFYSQAYTRMGFGEAVEEVQRLWAAGDRESAGAAVPIEIGLRTNLVGDDDDITGRLRSYRDAGVDTIRVGVDLNPKALDDLARLMDLVDTVNAESPSPST